MSRVRNALLWCLPLAVFTCLYWFAMRVWFQQDDFAWLGQGLYIQNWHDLMRAIFEPRAQGTIRPLSERIFFMALFDRFGLDHRPFHLWVALTQIANLLLLQSATLRITKSRLAAVAVPCVWLCGTGLATPLSWISSYNQVLCAFFFLLAFRLLLQFIETGAARWWWAQAAVFVLGFGALEINVVYPALAAGWCWLCARQHFKKALWLFPVSALYAVIHFAAAPNPKDGLYAQHWDLSMVRTYLVYWAQALSAGRLRPSPILPDWSWLAASIVLGLAALAFAWRSWRRGEKLPAYGIFWFTVVLGPVLPLRDHISDYYVAVPSIGVAWIAGYALFKAWQGGRLWFAGTLVLVALHLAFVLPVNREITDWRWQRGLRIKTLVQGLERAHELHPDKLIMLHGMDSDLFWSGYYDEPYRIFGLNEVCLAPGSENSIEAHPELGSMAKYICSPATAAGAAGQKKLIVYGVEARTLRNMTQKYVSQMPRSWKDAKPRVVDAGLPDVAQALGRGWYENQGPMRWMGRQAEVELAGPEKDGEILFLQGYCPESFLDRPIVLSVSVDGQRVGSGEVTRAHNSFEFSFPLPSGLKGSSPLKVVLAVDRVVVPPNDGRELGLVFGRIGLKQASAP